MRWILPWLLLWAMAASPAQAHLMAAGQGAIRLVGDSAFAVIAVPVASLSGFDDNGDRLLDRIELEHHRSAISAQVTAMLSLNAEGRAGRLLFEDLLLAHEGEAKGEDSLVVMRRYQWSMQLNSLTLGVHLFDRAPAADRQLLVRVIKGADAEVALMSAHRPQFQFFAGPWATLGNFVAAGAEHILLGPDHLLFLLTILVVGAGWRYWLVVVTSFTVAHSITLALAALDWVQAPPRLVEPLIAASIVALALDNLLRGRVALKHRPVLVFACGLLHGLGIASGLMELGLGGQNRIMSLLGFNVGVELGQVAFVAGVLGMLALARKQLPPTWHTRLLRTCSAFAAIVGTGWVVQRSLGWG